MRFSLADWLRLLLLGSLLGSPALRAAEDIARTDVFVSGEDGYHTYRIPAILRTPAGTLLAFCEGRKQSGSDTGDIDLLLKRSTDGGRTWSAATVVWDDGPNTCGNPCPVVDQRTGRIWLLSTHNLGQDRERDIRAGTSVGTRTVWVLHSEDDGLSWSEPRDITATTKDPSWGWYATGPGIGIQILHGPHAGRLVIPSDHSYRDETGAGELGSHAVYSDDGGLSWKLGGLIRPKVNECQVVELFDGRGTLLMDMRSYFGASRRTHALSLDGGLSWTGPQEAPELIEPVCQASILRFPDGPHARRGLMLFSNPADPKRRIQLTVRASEDNGRTWPYARLLHAGPTAYSCLVALDDTDVGCLYENGAQRPYERITFARFPARAIVPSL